MTDQEDTETSVTEAPNPDASATEEAVLPLFEWPGEAQDPDQVGPDPMQQASPVNLEAVRSRLEVLTKEYESEIQMYSSLGSGTDLVPPEHFGAEELLRAANRPIDWQVKNLWTQKAKVLLASEPKAGKTFFVCEMVIALAAGIQLWEKLPVEGPVPVGVIAGEDDEGEIGRRLQRMCRARGLMMSNLPIHWWPGDRLRLNRPRDIEWIKSQIRKYSLKLIICDPVARLMDGDENSKESVAGILNPLSSLVRSEECTVAIVHHLRKESPETPTSLSQRIRGSSDFASWYSCGIFLTGKLSNGRVGVEIDQRTSGSIPASFTVRAVEKEDESVYGLGSIKLVANLEDNLGRDAGEGANQQLVDSASEKIMQLIETKGRYGVTISEITVNLGLPRSLVNSALKKLIREDMMVAFEDDKGIPDGKVLVPLGEVAERVGRGSSRSSREEIPPAPVYNDQGAGPSIAPPAAKPVPQSELFDPERIENSRSAAQSPLAGEDDDYDLFK